MQIRFLQPRPELAPYVDTFWLFQSDFGLPVTDNRVIAPNAKAKIVLPFRNAMATNLDGIITPYREQDILFIGIWDRPVTLSTHAAQMGTIGLELSPKGAYRFSRVPMQELANRIYTFSELYGAPGRAITERIGNEFDPLCKADLIQDFMVKLLATDSHENAVIDFSVDLITRRQGLVEVSELVRKTGYSKRYVDMLFQQHLGISPKTLSTILRFQHFYRLWATTDATDFFRESLYELYYDQAHFIKEFRRYTGHTPKQYAQQKNDLGKIFYKSESGFSGVKD